MDQMTYSMPRVEELLRSFFVKVYGWMASALALTALVAMQVASTPQLRDLIIGTPGIMIFLLVLELVIVGVLSFAITRISAMWATIGFFLYSAINGLTLSVIFLAYTGESLASTFFVTAGTFAAVSFYGYVTRKDLSGWGSIFFMALIGMIIASLVNLFLKSSMLYWITTYIGVLIFVGLTAYDTFKLKQMCLNLPETSEAYTKMAVMGALTLYLDFINLFLLLLRIMGRRRN